MPKTQYATRTKDKKKSTKLNPPNIEAKSFLPLCCPKTEKHILCLATAALQQPAHKTKTSSQVPWGLTRLSSVACLQS